MKLRGLELLVLLLAGALMGVPLRGEPAPERLLRRSPPPSVAVPAPSTVRCGPLPCSFVRPLLRPEQAPPLDHPPAVAADAVPLRGSDLVLGLELGGQARAYPLNLLRYHRVINDELGGRAIAVAHSPISAASVCVDRTGLGRLRHSGSMLEGDELIVDGDGARWSPLLGRRLRENGRPGSVLHCPLMRWSAWRRLRPASQVSWPRRAVLGFDYRLDAWEWYRRDRFYLVGPVHYLDLRLPHKQEVLGIVVPGEARAYALPAAGRRVVHALVAGRPVLLLFDAESSFAAAYDGRLDGRTVELDADLGDGHGSRFSLLGEAISGPLKGSRLRPLEGGRSLFFAWAAFHHGRVVEARNEY